MLESRLGWALGTRTLFCRYFGGARMGNCIEEGAWPPPGSLYTQDCVSYAYGSFVPGGSGAWRCGTRHTTFASG